MIIDLCGGTGSWSQPYKDAGYDVRVITLPENDVKIYRHPNNVYGVLAAPPCTHFSIARTTAKEPRNLAEGMETVEACLKIIWSIQKLGKLKFWCLENPRGLLRRFLGIPALTFQPNEFGDLHTKCTDLWGLFNFPKMVPIMIPERAKALLAKNNRLLPQLPLGYKPPYGRNQAARRAMTPTGFARYFFEANR